MTIRTLVLVTIIVALGAALGTAWALSRQGDHHATAVVMLHPLEGNAYSPGGRGDELVNLETEAQVLRSDAVARAVLSQLGDSGSTTDLLAAVEVEVPPNTQLLEITARGPDDATATERASAFATAYLAYRRARTLAAVADRTSRLKELLTIREDERSEALTRLDASLPGAPERSLLDQQVQELTLQISSLRAELVASEAVGLDPGQIVTPGRPAAPGLDARPAVMGVAGGAAAAVLALALLVARNGRRRAEVVRTPEDLHEFGPPALGAAATPVQVDEGAVTRMRSALLAVGTDRPLVVAVAALGEDRSSCHRALVHSLVRARYELVSVDLEATRSAEAMAALVRETVGVDDVLRAQGQFLSELRLPSGGDDTPDRADADEAADAPQVTDLADLAASTAMRRSLRELAKRAELVVVRSPGTGTAVGRGVLAAADAVLIEVPAGRHDRGAVEAVVAEARQSRCEVVGLVLVRSDAARSARSRRTLRTESVDV